MGKKAAFLVGAGVGYFFGTKAGRARYEQIKTQASRFFHDDHVQSAVSTAKDKLAEAADTAGGAVGSKVADAAAAAGDAVKHKVAALKNRDEDDTSAGPGPVPVV